jgi:hypothetical protein
MSQVRAVPWGDSGRGDGSAVRWLGAGDTGVVDSRGSGSAPDSGLEVAELGEGLAWSEGFASGDGLCCSASSRKRGPRMSARLVVAEVALGEEVGVAVGAGGGPAPSSSVCDGGLRGSPLG